MFRPMTPEQTEAFNERVDSYVQERAPPVLADVERYPDVRDDREFEPGVPDFARAAARQVLRDMAGAYPEPEDLGLAEPSALAEVEYVDDFLRPGRIVAVAAEEGSGKSFAIAGELGVRLALADGSFAGTWQVVTNEHVAVLSEMHADDDLARLDLVCRSLGHDRTDLAGRYWRLSLATAANGAPPLADAEWRRFILAWLRTRSVRLLIIDTATGAADVDPWGRSIQALYRDLRAMLATYPELAIVLLVHLKKPQGHGERRLSDVLGEWGRWCDVVLLMEAEGRERTKLTVRKRVRTERRIVATKRDGLLVDPRDVETGGPKVPADDVVAAVEASPGLSYGELAKALKVTKPTATNYVKALGDRISVTTDGPKGAHRLWSTAKPPNSAKQEGFGGALAVETADRAADRQTAKPPYIEMAVGFAVDSTAVEDDYPPSAYDR
jgi:hypothetical protein